MKNYNKLWIVPEENLVVLTTENKNLSHSNEKVLEILFLVDFDVDYPLEIEITLTNIHQFVDPSKKYPWILENMAKTDFQNWNNSYLQEYLADRFISKTRNKEVLIKNAYGAYCLNLLDGQQGKMKNYEEKLILEKDLVTLPDAVIPQDGWFNAPENLPNFAYNDIID